MKQSNKQTPFVFRLALGLFCAVLLSISLMGGLYARYVTTASGSDSARVAKFNVTEELTVTRSDGTKVTDFVVDDVLKPGESVSYRFTVQNDSEVAVKFIVSGERLFNELPLTLETAEKVIAPGASDTVTFTVLWDSNENSLSYGGKIDMIQLTARAEQID